MAAQWPCITSGSYGIKRIYSQNNTQPRIPGVTRIQALLGPLSMPRPDHWSLDWAGRAGIRAPGPMAWCHCDYARCISIEFEAVWRKKIPHCRALHRGVGLPPDPPGPPPPRRLHQKHHDSFPLRPTPFPQTDYTGIALANSLKSRPVQSPIVSPSSATPPRPPSIRNLRHA